MKKKLSLFFFFFIANVQPPKWRRFGRLYMYINFFLIINMNINLNQKTWKDVFLFFFLLYRWPFFFSYIKLYYFETGQSNEINMANKLPCFEVKNLMRQSNNSKKRSIFRSNLKWKISVLNVLNFINLLLHFQPDQIWNVWCIT